MPSTPLGTHRLLPSQYKLLQVLRSLPLEERHASGVVRANEVDTPTQKWVKDNTIQTLRTLWKRGYLTKSADTSPEGRSHSRFVFAISPAGRGLFDETQQVIRRASSTLGDTALGWSLKDAGAFLQSDIGALEPLTGLASRQQFRMADVTWKDARHTRWLRQYVRDVANRYRYELSGPELITVDGPEEKLSVQTFSFTEHGRQSLALALHRLSDPLDGEAYRQHLYALVPEARLHDELLVVHDAEQQRLRAADSERGRPRFGELQAARQVTLEGIAEGRPDVAFAREYGTPATVLRFPTSGATER